MDDAVGGAVGIWCEGGGVIGAGASEIREVPPVTSISVKTKSLEAL